MRFQIEAKFKVSGRGSFITAVYLEPEKEFRLTSNARMGDLVLTSFLDRPRALDEKGMQRDNVFLFQLADEKQFEIVREGEILILQTED